MEIAQGRIRSLVRPDDAEPAETAASTAPRYIAPGLIDIQLNGYAGINLSDWSITPDKVGQLVRLLAATGVTRFCPTVVTGPVERMKISVRTIAEACAQDAAVRHAVAGIHVEGPFISPIDGPRGAHRLADVREPCLSEYEAWQEISGRRIAKVTLAPERPGALAMIGKLREDGVIAAIGHTAASEPEIQAAIDAGATMSTHLGNGSHPLIPRFPNYMWAQMADDRLWAGLIPDGFHLPPSTLKVMLRAKGDKAILTSDAVFMAGMPPGTYALEGGRRAVLEESGFLHLEETPNILAGSALPLCQGVGNVAKWGLAGLPRAIEMASLHPACLLGPERAGTGRLEVGETADFFIYTMDPDGDMVVRETIANGIVLYSQRHEHRRESARGGSAREAESSS